MANLIEFRGRSYEIIKGLECSQITNDDYKYIISVTTETIEGQDKPHRKVVNSNLPTKRFMENTTDENFDEETTYDNLVAYGKSKYTFVLEATCKHRQVLNNTTRIVESTIALFK